MALHQNITATVAVAPSYVRPGGSIVNRWSIQLTGGPIVTKWLEPWKSYILHFDNMKELVSSSTEVLVNILIRCSLPASVPFYTTIM